VGSDHLIVLLNQEIERLHAEIESLRADAAHHDKWAIQQADLMRLDRAEIHRLRELAKVPA
jgi:hypothetical protein